MPLDWIDEGEIVTVPTALGDTSAVADFTQAPVHSRLIVHTIAFRFGV